MNIENKHFTIIIPTLNRVETLKYSIKACLNQNYDSFTIIVSDNFSDDDVKGVIDHINDQRVQYMRTPHRMNMCDHWNYIFSKQNFKNTFVSIIGDDDALIMDSLPIANKILNDADLNILSWRKAEYMWPNCLLTKQRNILSLNMDTGYFISDSKKMLKKLYLFECGYNELPCIYNSFIHSDIINTFLKKKNGRLFFNSSSPDVYSAIVAATSVKKYIYSNYPISINGASAASNGIRVSHSFGHDEKVEDFQKVSHLSKELINDCFTATAVMDGMIQASKKLDLKYKPDFTLYLKVCINELRCKKSIKAIGIGYKSIINTAKSLNLNLNKYFSEEEYIDLKREVQNYSEPSINIGMLNNVLNIDMAEFKINDLEGVSEFTGFLLGYKNNRVKILEINDRNKKLYLLKKSYKKVLKLLLIPKKIFG